MLLYAILCFYMLFWVDKLLLLAVVGFSAFSDLGCFLFEQVPCFRTSIEHLEDTAWPILA